MREICIFNSNKKCNDCGECDYCVYDNKKICNNCGKCLEDEGIDIKAIRIEEIAKNVEENDFVENEFVEDEFVEVEESDDTQDDEADFEEDVELAFTESNEEYEDAWDHIEYVEDLDGLVEDETYLEENSNEVFPGLRRIKGNI
ncbi:hypothetical protein [Clostridium paridis]|uniref:Uncharacterized protein n=1 Tax=Clostridium paridis TaxID=2803863 RepID=A0A937K3L8_9CLOT|nr:hypothetical protein [Clostridium paridis]MBL4930914.1 hypothetical protein [Clostridium paridis]